MIFEDIYYFDPTGNSLSLPGGLKNYYKDKNYYFMIKADQIANITYSVSISLPTGKNPVSNVQLVNSIYYMTVVKIFIVIRFFHIEDVCMLDCVFLFPTTKK